jgi:hypothetical protein
MYKVCGADFLSTPLQQSLVLFLQQFISPSAFLFPSKSFPHQKAKSQKPQAKSPQQKAQSKKPKAKASFPPSVSLLYPVVSRVEQQFWGGA